MTKRTTFALQSESRQALEKIQTARGVKSAAAAINEAVQFRARLAHRDLREVESALALLDMAKEQRGKGRDVCAFVGKADAPTGGVNIMLGFFHDD